VSQTYVCMNCKNEVYQSVIDESGGHCAFCDEFMRPPSEILSQWRTVREGTSGEWEDIREALKNNQLDALEQFLLARDVIVVHQIEELNRAMDSTVEVYMEPEELKV